MKKLSVQIEINGKNVYVGDIIGNNSNDACFSYTEEYYENPENKAISLILPLHEKHFDSQKTRNFFEGVITRRLYQKVCG